jgi:diguanylate cyclase (GGDEF)-like protein/PAS domain S-box-containing protein
VSGLADGAEGSTDLLDLLYLLPFAVLKTDMQGNVALVNPTGAQLLMPLAPAADLSNVFTIFDEVTPELREMVARFPGRAGRICDEYRVVASAGPAGHTKSYVLSVTVQKIDADVLVVVISDVSAEAEREAYIRIHEARLHALFDGMRDYGICTVDPHGIVTSWNRSAQQMDGYRADEIIGVPVSVLFPTSPASTKGFTDALGVALRDGSYEYEGWRVRKNGTRYWANCVISVLRDPGDDTHIGFSVISRDRTLRKRNDEELLNLTVTDPLTGAANRRGLFGAGLREDERRKRSGGTTSVLMLDLDYFKTVNDDHGHQAGDAVLRHIVKLAKAEIRSVDLIGRYGGEEFTVVLPGSSLETAHGIAERIRASIERTPVVIDGVAIRMTVSIGVASVSASVDDLAHLIGAADAALFDAKSAGRNRVVVSTEAGTSAS